MPPKTSIKKQSTSTNGENIEKKQPQEKKAQNKPKQEEKKPDEKKNKHKQISLRDHILKKPMWVGAKVSTLTDYYAVENGKLTFAQLDYPPILLKLIDEILVNSIDHYTSHPKDVTTITIKLDNGTISIMNDGLGIPIYETETINNKKMYSVQMIFSEFMSGSNLDDDNDRIVGGTNGLGAKLVGVFSTSFVVETFDVTTDTYYKQEFTDGLLTIHEPTIVRPGTPEHKKIKHKGFTRVTFTPNYSLFLKDDKPLAYKTIHETLDRLIYARIMLAAFGTPIKFIYNDQTLYFKTFERACDVLPYNVVTFNMEHPKYPWKIGVGLSDGKSRQLSVVNGLVISGGPHIQYIQNLLVSILKPKIEKELKKVEAKFNKNLLLNNLFIVMIGHIPNIDPNSQTKETFAYDVKKFNCYDIDEKSIAYLWNSIKNTIIDEYLTKQIVETKTKANRKRIDASKYTEARLCKHPTRWREATLIITEGDSASGTAHEGLVSKKTSENFNYEYFGLYSIQGVSVNGLKASIEKEKTKKVIKKRKVDEDEDKEDDEDYSMLNGKKIDVPNVHIPRRPKKLLKENKRLSILFDVLNLDFNKTYATDAEWKTLRYGAIAALVDQDLDGFNIFGLIATLILTYWPELVKRGFVRRINTPLVRYFPKKKSLPVMEFYTENQAEKWVDENTLEYVQSNYKLPPSYYKGLGSHDPNIGEVDAMFQNIDDKICTYILDEKAIESMYIYYGSDSYPRKVALSTPVTYECVEGLSLPLSQQFHVDTKMYQRDNILRKIINLIDGFIAARRKVFYTAQKVGNEKIKVAGLAAETVPIANYHHGEASIENTIVYMAQSFKGARNLPLLLPMGNFGTRDAGFKNAAGGRYIHTKINDKLANKLFRREDSYILEYEIDDGKRYEPKYYVPIIPYALCETNNIPGTGWRVAIYARELDDIFQNVRNMIRGKIDHCQPLNMAKIDNGEIRIVNDKKYFVAKYVYNPKENSVIITGLPPNVYSKPYIKGDEQSKNGIESLEWVDEVHDKTNNLDGVCIEVLLKPGAYDAIVEAYGNDNFDPFEEYFELKQHIKDHINLVNQKGEVIEYQTYEKVFDDWFVFRKELYTKRIDREVIINDLEIQMLKNQQRFSDNYNSYKITKMTSIDQIVSILTENKYDTFNKSMLDNPQYTELNQLRDMICSINANYEYLLKMDSYAFAEEGYLKRAKKIEELEQRQKYLKDNNGLFKGAKIWEIELDELEKNIKEGVKTNWSYGEQNYVFNTVNMNGKTDKPKKKVLKK